uniref:Nebulin-related-anchoring protein-like n=1 Tax=Camelus bactrianus TaxID=9837 RepID=A0A9W3H3M7_CAMBA|nr:nebulin-related-anchoring protein-like [Camelus bactrianus]
MTGYDLKADAIGFKHAKASRDIASDYLYKTTYEKQKGHYIGCRTAKEDPKLVFAANVMKMQNDRLYKKAYNDHKAKITIPVDMVSINAAKEGQALASDVDYRHYLHHWSCFPDQNDVIQARKAYDLQSDVSCCSCRKYQRTCPRGELLLRKKVFHSFAPHSLWCSGKCNSLCKSTSL